MHAVPVARQTVVVGNSILAALIQTVLPLNDAETHSITCHVSFWHYRYVAVCQCKEGQQKYASISQHFPLLLIVS